MNEYALFPYPFFFLILTYGYITQMKIKGTLLQWGVFAIVVVSWGIWPCFNDTPASSKEDSTNRFTYSSLNTLFTGCAFWGAWMAYRTQRKGVEKAQEQTQIAKEQTYNAALFEYLYYIQSRKNIMGDMNDWIKATITRFYRYIEIIEKCKQTGIIEEGPLPLVSGSKKDQLEILYLHISDLTGWANIVFEWKNYVETSDLPLENKHALFFRLWNSLFENERFSAILVGVFTGKICKDEVDELLGFHNFQKICDTSSHVVIDIMFELLASEKEINGGKIVVEDIIRKYLPEEVIAS